MNIGERAAVPLKPLYHPKKALEHMHMLQGLTPIRLFGILFPLWDIETTATQREGRPYELIEKYIERGINEGELHTVEELKNFLGLQNEMVKKVLNFLHTLGHVTCTGTYWDLTPLGKLSVREGTKFIQNEKRTRLYFDAFTSLPLQKAHYNKRHVKILAPEEIVEVLNLKTWGYRFSPISSITQWQSASLPELEARVDRGDYNVPPEMQNIQVLGVKLAYLPMYVIETQQQTAFTSTEAHVQFRPYYLVYTGIPGLRDTYFEQLVNNNQTVYAALTGEKELAQHALWREWLQEKGITGILPQERADGSWQVSLPAWVFEGPQPKLAMTRIGDYELKSGYFMQIWCDQEPLRRQAALDNLLKMVKNQQRYIKRTTIQEHLQLQSRLLQTESQLSIADLHQRAIKMGMKDLVRLLETI